MFAKTKLITPAASLPVTLTEARAHLRIDDTTEDTLITTLINAATEYAELRTGRALITQTWAQYYDCFPTSQKFDLKHSPIQSVTHVKYYDVNNVLQTLAASNYDVDIIAEPGTISVASGGTGWEGTYSKPNAVIIQYIAGYGAASTNIPEMLREAIKLLISHFFENREGINTVGQFMDLTIPKATERILSMFNIRDQF